MAGLLLVGLKQTFLDMDAIPGVRVLALRAAD